jgi:transposase
MSLHPKDWSTVPEETVRVARLAFPKGNPCLTLRDELGIIYKDETFAPLFKTTRGRPAESSGCLALGRNCRLQPMDGSRNDLHRPVVRSTLLVAGGQTTMLLIRPISRSTWFRCQ